MSNPTCPDSKDIYGLDYLGNLTGTTSLKILGQGGKSHDEKEEHETPSKEASTASSDVNTPVVSPNQVSKVIRRRSLRSVTKTVSYTHLTLPTTPYV